MPLPAGSGGENNSDTERVTKSSIKLPLEFAEQVQYFSVQNQNTLKWKFTSRKSKNDKSEATSDQHSFKIFSIFSKNFESAYYLLEELIEQLDMSARAHTQLVTDLWLSLIKICCAQSFAKRLKILNLLVKIINKVTSESLKSNACESLNGCISLNALKPLKSLHYALETTGREDRNLSRALYELFFFAEKLAVQWRRQTEYLAHMKVREEFLEKISEASCFINFLISTHNLAETTASVGFQKTRPSVVKTVIKLAKPAVLETEEDEEDEDLAMPALMMCEEVEGESSDKPVEDEVNGESDDSEVREEDEDVSYNE
jgi:hypothetical protein